MSYVPQQFLSRAAATSRTWFLLLWHWTDTAWGTMAQNKTHGNRSRCSLSRRTAVLLVLFVLAFVASAEPSSARRGLKVVEDEIGRSEQAVRDGKQELAGAEERMSEATAALKACNIEKRCKQDVLDAVMASTEMAARLKNSQRERIDKL